MICAMESNLEVNHSSSMQLLLKCDVETWILQWTNTENELFTEVEEIVCLAVQLLEWKIFTYLNVSIRRKK